MKLSENVKKFFTLLTVKYALQHEYWDSFFNIAERHSRETYPGDSAGRFNLMRDIVAVARTLDKDCVDKAGFIPTGFSHSPDSHILDLTSMTDVSEIHQLAFLYPEMTTVIIPSNITSIDAAAFCCGHKVKMIYKGTIAEFDTKLRANMNSYVISEVCCSDGCIQL